MHEPTGLRERKKGETRQAISAAALALALERGPAAVTVDDIAAAANVSARTVFNHFPSKEAAILGIDPERRVQMLACIESRPPRETPLTAIVAATADYYTDDRADLWRSRALLVRDHPQLHAAYVASFSSLEEDLAEVIGRRTGLDADRHPYPRLVADVAVTAMRAAIRRALDDTNEITVHQSMCDTFAVLAGGLTPPPAATHGAP